MHSFTSYLMSTYYVLGTVLSLGRQAHKKFMELTSWEDTNKTLDAKALCTL